MKESAPIRYSAGFETDSSVFPKLFDFFQKYEQTMPDRS